MANFTHKRVLTEKVTIKGTVSDDAEIILVTDKDGDKEVKVQDYLDKFRGEYVEVSIQTKSEDDLSDEE